MSVEIIIKKLQKVVQAPAGNLCFGDVRTQMAIDLLKKLTQIIESKASYQKPYYILVHATLDMGAPGRVGGIPRIAAPDERLVPVCPGRVIKEKILILPCLPSHKLIGSLAFKIDNALGDAELVWNLPLDIPGVIGESEPSKDGRIATDAKGLPIVNTTLQ